jgi:hypothetical protein
MDEPNKGLKMEFGLLHVRSLGISVVTEGGAVGMTRHFTRFPRPS